MEEGGEERGIKGNMSYISPMMSGCYHCYLRPIVGLMVIPDLLHGYPRFKSGHSHLDGVGNGFTKCSSV